MATSVSIKHSASGLVKEGYFGFSWTYLLFGWFVPLFRGELGVGALHLIFTFVTFEIWQFIVCFLYNKQYMIRMLTSGWVLADVDHKNSLAAAKLGISLDKINQPAQPDMDTNKSIESVTDESIEEDPNESHRT